MNWRIVMASVLAAVAGLALGEALCSWPAGRDTIGRLCGRGNLLVLADDEGIYETDVERAIAEIRYKSGQDQSEPAEIDRLSTMAGNDLAKIIVARRRSANVDLAASRVSRDLNLLRTQFRDGKGWKASLRASALSEHALRGVLADELRILDWISGQISPQLNGTTEECHEYYRQHPEKYSLPERWRVGHLFLAAPSQTPPEIVDLKKQKIESIAKRIRDGEDFTALTASESEDEATKMQGGDLGYFTDFRMPRDFIESLVKLAPGQISSPVRTSLGFHIIQMLDIKPPRAMTFEEVSVEIATQLRNEKRREALQKLDVDLRAGIRVVAESWPGSP